MINSCSDGWCRCWCRCWCGCWCRWWTTRNRWNLAEMQAPSHWHRHVRRQEIKNVTSIVSEDFSREASKAEAVVKRIGDFNMYRSIGDGVDAMNGTLRLIENPPRSNWDQFIEARNIHACLNDVRHLYETDVVHAGHKYEVRSARSVNASMVEFTSAAEDRQVAACDCENGCRWMGWSPWDCDSTITANLRENPMRLVHTVYLEHIVTRNVSADRRSRGWRWSRCNCGADSSCVVLGCGSIQRILCVI
mmetsp:Transcript_31428/g.55541  ORF Transcript_31428/g.55541 Transcript_31428/m.55541 type:complete len:248 (-) Transcript_31428:33-776(-)